MPSKSNEYKSECFWWFMPFESCSSTQFVRLKMKLFQSFIQYLEFVGVYSLKTHQPQTFNAKILFFLSIIALMCISMSAFCLLEATTITEYGTNFFGIISDFSNSLDYVIIIWRLPVILKLIRNCEKFIEMSKFDTFFAFHRTSRWEFGFIWIDFFYSK